MDTGQPARRSLLRRTIEIVLVVTILLITFVSGVWFGPSITPWYFHGQEPALVPIPKWTPSPIYDTSKGFPVPGAPAPVDPRQDEPQAVKARTEAIQRTAAVIREECQRAAGGDWEKWQKDTQSYRNDLKAKLAALRDLPPPQDGPLYEALEGRDGFPLFEVDSRKMLAYLHDPATLDAFRREQPVVAAHRWFRQQGIDLIFVPVPKMTEIYVEHFLDPCPADGIVAPHVRRTLLELLDAGVEVVDGFPLFRSLRDTDAEYLYNTADTHWAPRATRIMAKEIADRISRYRFGARARFTLPIVRTFLGPYIIRGNIGAFDEFGSSVLINPEQQERARPVQTTTLTEVRFPDNSLLRDDPESPVLLTGHSYVENFREQLVKELNLLTHTRSFHHQTTEIFVDFLRQPEELAHCRVVVWISTEHHLTQFKPMPQPVLKALDSSK